jgi:universal stress protein E
MSKRILSIIDPSSEEQPGAERAAWLAEKLGTDLELFVCEYDQHLINGWSFEGKSLEKARKRLLDKEMKRLRKMARELSADGVDVSVDVKWGHPLHEGIVRKAVGSRSAIVVKDTHYHTAFRRSIFSNTDWNLIRECPMPLLLVKPNRPKESFVIVAAVDPMHEHDKPAALDHEILRTAETLSAAIGAPMHVLHTFDPSLVYAVSVDAMTSPISTPVNMILEQMRRTHEETVETLIKPYAVPRENVHVIEGGTPEALGALVEEINAGVVIMGAVSRSVVQRFVIGSTAERVLDHLPCDLLIVKPEGFVSSIVS